MKRLFVVACGAAVSVGSSLAADFTAVRTLSQTEFRSFSEDLAATVSYKPMIPSEGLGLTGFDLGVSAAATRVANRDVLRKAAGGASVPSALPVVALRATKGLPFDIDIGVTSLQIADNNTRAVGGELRWAFVAGSTAVPAVALRFAATRLSGVNDLTLRSTSADISISKGFAFLTPYAGAGYVSVNSEVKGVTLKKESFGQSKVFAGLNIAFTPLALLIEADRTGDTTTAGVKLALRW
jgi:hypothetical protein